MSMGREDIGQGYLASLLQDGMSSYGQLLFSPMWIQGFLSPIHPLAKGKL